jgi:hypothetical protein
VHQISGLKLIAARTLHLACFAFSTAVIGFFDNVQPLWLITVLRIYILSEISKLSYSVFHCLC